MEIYVSGNCKFALLATIIDERIFFLYFVWKHYFSFHLSLSFSEKKKMVFSNLILNFYTRLDNG